ncbi:MAG: hypothetical protein ACYTGL_08770 [Planctomycetota bacterium]|jgi:hypothetical protein
MTLCHRNIFTLATLLSITASQHVFAQVSVQVPVVQSFGGQFSTVVPDRGTVYLGGFQRAGRSYSRPGCGCLPRSAPGYFVESSSLSARVWIHDLREMDRLVLDAAASPTAAAELRASGLIDNSPVRSSVRVSAFRDDHLGRRDHSRFPQSVASLRPTTSRFGSTSSYSRQRSSRRETVTRGDEDLPRVVVVNRSAATQWYRLGRTAEDSGKVAVAKLHYRQAARYGSVLALNRLKELSK